ncbi:hypothetical protein PHYSODRAFT_294288 [Phytophthora sojae]|uniref:Uncharacterized protein n=1 Tax=Phytophthora sojae (strain P6497) TaxID=1094619 RepID=G4YMN6_PHYSP|nr:hypothetical protein PHYSODRAFT_294288 [Phytophthora sojae]EGZ28911.1 hypothetical protein PHYSODRAFT_294288 [Phytophthora sojae]|eukprot:XP_009516186.1 hypothetical protein PHYSODRAFT_294288 [Phytophthora sojae]
MQQSSENEAVVFVITPKFRQEVRCGVGTGYAVQVQVTAQRILVQLRIATSSCPPIGPFHEAQHRYLIHEDYAADEEELSEPGHAVLAQRFAIRVVPSNEYTPAETFDTAVIDDGPHGVVALGGGGSLATSELKSKLDLTSRQADIRARNDRTSSSHGNPMSGFYAQGWSEKDGDRANGAARRKFASGVHGNQGQDERVHQGQDPRTEQENENKIRQDSKTSKIRYEGPSQYEGIAGSGGA